MRKILTAVLVLSLFGIVGLAQTKVVNVMHGWPGEQAPGIRRT